MAPIAYAASIPAVSRPAGAVIAVQEQQQRSQRDRTPYNGPFGFYGNVWCQPANEAGWPMQTLPSLKAKRAQRGTDL
jgi:hypothetical protein